MNIVIHSPALAPSLTELAVALQSGEETAIDFGAFPMPCFEAGYFAEHSEHIVLAGDGITSWNRHERIISLATGAPSMDCVRLGFRGA
jgi:flagellar biosynthesis/type III secretory pathway ATPase